MLENSNLFTRFMISFIYIHIIFNFEGNLTNLKFHFGLEGDVIRREDFTIIFTVCILVVQLRLGK